MMHKGLLIVVAVVCVCLTLGQIRAENQLLGVNNQTPNVTKLQARILLESKNLDIDNEKPTVTCCNNDKSSESITLVHSTNSTNNNSSSTGTKLKKKIKRKKERSERKLSNLWSMFLPGSSSSESDYEEVSGSEELSGESGLDGEPITVSGGGNITTNGDRNGQQNESSTKLPNDEKSNHQASKHDDLRPIARYSRPPRQDGSSGSEFSGAQNSTSRSESSTTNQAPSNESRVLTGTLTGSLSKDTSVIFSSASASANETAINVSNVNNSVGSLDTVERENDEKLSLTNARDNNKTSSENSSFERWLNRIQFQENPLQATTTSTTTTTTSTTELPQKNTPSRSSDGSILKISSLSNQNSLRDDGRAGARSALDILKLAGKVHGQRPEMTNTTLDSSSPQTRGYMLSKMLAKHQLALGQDHGNKQMMNENFLNGRHNVHQQFHHHGHKGQKFRSGPSAMTHAQRLPAHVSIRADEHSQGYHHHHSPRFQPPFPQQFRQNQAQLIQGIKYPTSSASTISLSTQDGTSNTSLSFSPNLSLMSSLNNEISPVIGPASSNGNGNDAAVGGQMAQTEYQSQDEILRQVTSAINFEQQLMTNSNNNNNQQQQQQQKRPSSDSSNHRKAGEPLEGSLGQSVSGNDLEAPADNKLFKMGSNLNEQVDPMSVTTSSSLSASMSPLELLKASMNRNNNNGNGNGSTGGGNQMFGTDDLDKNFDMLAEKLRSLVAQHSQQTTANQQRSQPSWLRRPDQAVAGGLDNAINGKDLLGAGGSNNNNNNLTAQLTGFMNVSSSSSSSSSSSLPTSTLSNLEKLRELLNRHEKSKNELKSSQATMSQLLQQLMQSPSDNTNNNNGKNSDKIAQQQLLQDGINNNHNINNMAMTHQQQQLVRGAIESGGQLQQQQQQQQQQQLPVPVQQALLDRPPVAPANFGWTPLSQGHLMAINGLPQMHGAPLSPANLIKSRARQPGLRLSPSTSQLLAQQEHNLGDYGGEQHYMNELALMLANGRPSEEANELLAGGHKILGVPVAFMGEEDVATAAAVEEQAMMTAKHLARHNRQHLLRNSNNNIINNNNNNKIAQRLASASAGGQAVAEQLVPATQAAHLPGQHQHQIDRIKSSYPLQALMANHQQALEPMAMPPFALGGQHYQQQQQASGSQNYSARPASQQPGPVQAQGAQQGQEALLVGSQRVAPLVVGAAGSSSGLGAANQTPIRYREVSIYRPFGFQSHHALAYQASPAVAALFPGLAQGGAARPSLLSRHRRPYNNLPFLEI